MKSNYQYDYTDDIVPYLNMTLNVIFQLWLPEYPSGTIECPNKTKEIKQIGQIKIKLLLMNYEAMNGYLDYLMQLLKTVVSELPIL